MHTKAFRCRSSVLAAVLLLSGGWPLESAAQVQDKPPKPGKLFGSDKTLDVTLRAPWRQVMRKQSGIAPFPATIEYLADDGSRQSLALTVERRGITRLQVCDFPPIRLRFDKETIKGTLFRGNKSIKLVTHCEDGGRWQQYYLLEMLSYRIYNLLTERSFRVRPLSVSYVDSEKQSSDGPYFAFLIEDDSDVASRNNLDVLEIAKPRVGQFDADENNRFSLFQFMIGNTDWAILSGPAPSECCHNTRLIGPQDGQGIYAVPYDFDSAGLVDARYAAPSASLPIRGVRERIYRGFCVNNPGLPAARAELLQRESRILELVRSESRLTEKSLQSALGYLEEFFEILRDDGKFTRQITEKCRK